MKINLLDWVYALGDKTKPFSVREIIGNRLALTAPDYTRLYLGMEWKKWKRLQMQMCY